MSLEGRFWAKVNKAGPIPKHCPELGPCWIWTGAKHTFGYGKLFVERTAKGSRNEDAHRLGFILQGGTLRNGQSCLHKCDNPPCVRKTHLYAGTRKDNTRDCMQRGRFRPGRMPGEKNPAAKLTQSQANEIFSTYWRIRGNRAGAPKGTVTNLAVRFKVSVVTIGHIVTGRTW